MKKHVYKIGIVGVGRFGSRHLEKWQQIAQADVIGITDIDPAVCHKIQIERGLPSLSLDALIQQSEIIDIVVPAVSHYYIAHKALTAGKHVFIEKPFTENPEQARSLRDLALKNNLKVGIGHIERFNPVYKLLMENLTSAPQKFLAFRQGPFIPKVGLDVSIILELMVHDIDIVRQLIPYGIRSIHASGQIINSNKIDRATAILTFDNGSEAVLFASRAEDNRRREILCENHSTIYKANLMERKFSVSGKEDLQLGDYDAMHDELSAFIHAIENNEKHSVNESDGVETIEIAKRIEDIILENSL